MIRFNAFNLKAAARTLVVASALSTPSSTALAQSTATLPRSTVEAISISASHRTQINEFIETWSQRALSDKAQDNKRAMEALTKPLNERGVSVAFRQNYTTSITPLLNELDATGTIGGMISSLRIAGDLATPSSVSRVIGAMSNDDLGVQLFAVSRAGQIFSATTKHGPAMTANDASLLINSISTIASNEDTDAELLRACMRSLSAASKLSSKDMGDERSHAIIVMCDALGARLRSLNVNDDPTFMQGLALESAGAMTASISDISSNTSSDGARAAIGLGGDIISVTLRRMLGRTINPVNSRDLAIRSVQSGENLLFFALKKDAELNGNGLGTIKPTEFANLLAAGDDREFRNQTSSLLGAGSNLVKRFKFNNERFVR